MAESSHGLSRRAALRRGADLLEAGGLAQGSRDARFLLLGLMDLDSRDLLLHGDVPLADAAATAFDSALARRLAGEPVARILGAWEFWGLPFRLALETLVPRPDTETLVAAALAAMPDRTARLRCLDLGTGSGCILVALLHERPEAFGIGLDRVPAALKIARQNAAANGVAQRAAFVAGDWCDPLAGGFDLIVSNPPYIARGVIQDLDREVRIHDPTVALDGGPDGLDGYRRILDGVRTRELLAPGGRLAVEIGFDQGAALTALAEASGYVVQGLERDLAGHDRVVTLARSPGAGTV